MMDKRPIVISAGGTGGHMIPAHALAMELKNRGEEILLLTDERGLRFPGLFKDVQSIMVPSASHLRNHSRIRTAWTVIKGYWRARKVFKKYDPLAVIGFGGHATVPVMLAAVRSKIPSMIHEQNAVMGRSNRFLASWVDWIATSYDLTQRVKEKHQNKVILTGNPVRAEIRELANHPHIPLAKDGVFRLMIMGGSQGARIFSEIIPQALDTLPTDIKRRLQLTQQCRPEDIDRVREAYNRMGIAAELATYFEDIPEKLRWTNLVVSRAGASSISDLEVSGRPSILVPLQSAVDDHQHWNTQNIAAAGGACVILEKNFTVQEFSRLIRRFALYPGTLNAMAHACRKIARLDATDVLVEQVLRLVHASDMAGDLD